MEKEEEKKEKGISELSDKELLDEYNKIKPSPMLDALFIGFLIGIIIFSVVASTWGFITLIPLFLIYLFLKKSQKYKSLKVELSKRNLP